MASKSDKELRNEIAYLTSLIENHKKANVSHSKPNRPSKHSRTNKFKWTSNSISSSQKYKLTHSSTAHVTQTLQLVNTSSIPQSHSTPSNPNVHRYSNLHGNSHYSYGNLHRRPDNHHGTKRKWSNMTYLPPPRSSTATEPNIVSLTSLKRVSFKQSEEEKCKGRGNLTTAEGGLMSTSPRTTTIPPHLTWQSATASPHRGQTSHTKKSISSVSELQHQRHQTVVSNEATPISKSSHLTVSRRQLDTASDEATPLSKSSHPTVSRHQLDTASDEATPLSKSSHPTVSRRQLGTASTKYKWRRRSTSHSSSKKSHSVKSPISKSPTPRTKPHTPSWIVHNKYKLTHTSIVQKYSKILNRQRFSNGGISKLSRYVMRRTPSHSAVRKSRARNKVWLASDTKDSTSSSAKSTTPARRLSGHELKTKQGNRQWVSKRVRLSDRHQFLSTPSTSAVPSSAHPLKRLSGRESKTRHGNRQWVSKHVRRTPQLTSNYARGTGYRGFHKQKGRGSSVPGNRRRRNLFSSQLISLSGQKFVVDSGGCRMKRVSLSSTTSPLLHRPRIRSRGRSVSESRQTSVKQYLASRAVQRSRVYVWSAKQRKKKDAKQYCIFYNRFGKCNRGAACPFIHDPGKIAICTKFLRGLCDKTDGSCLFSHTISKDKMPTCSYFLHGVCTREVCPYLHVSVGRHAKVCLDFARGYCPNGEECTKQHIVDCPEFSEKGICSRGDKCLLRHKQRPPKRPTTRQPIAPTRTPLAFKRLQRRPDLVERGSGLSCSAASKSVSNKVSSHDEADESCDESLSDEERPHYSPLDPNCPAPDFLAL